MEITTLQIVLVFIVACIAGMGSILDEFQFHRPLIACTGGYRSWGYETGIIIGGTLEMIALGWMNIGAAVAPDAARLLSFLPFWLSQVIRALVQVSHWQSLWPLQAVH